MPTATPSALAAIDLGDSLYEVVGGQLVELPPMGSYSSWLISVLDQALGPYVKAHRLGMVVVEMLFLIDAATGLQRRPDVAFIADRRWPRGRRVPTKSPWEVVPDLAIEVNSPTNTGDELIARVREYFDAGVERVWVVYPEEALVYDYASTTSVRILDRTMSLECEALLPGFRLPLSSLFAVDEEVEAT